MSWFRRRRDRIESQLDAEVHFHLTRQTDDYVRQGMDQEAARRRALMEFGGSEQIKEECRDLSWLTTLDHFWHDLRYAFRVLRKNPGFTAAAVLSLALGIGANTAIFTVIDSFLLKNLPVREPERLVNFRHSNDPRPPIYNTSYLSLEKFRSLLETFSGLSAISVTDRSNVTINGPGGGLDAGLVRVALVSGNYFAMLGVHAVAGRTLTPGDDRVPGGHPVAVISYDYAQRHFSQGQDGSALGRTFALNGVTYTILGVAPRGFSGDWVGRPVDVWIPTMMQSQVMVETPGFLTRNNGWVRITGRLQSSVSIRQAQAAAAVVYKRHLLEQAGPHPAAEYLREIERQRLELVSAAAGYSPQWETFGRTLTILMIIAGLVLLVACANVANLLLARATARRREMAVRMAVGAGRGRIARQLLTENMVLSTLGSALGVLLAWWGASVLSTTVSLGPAQMDSRNPSQWVSLNFNLDGRILLFAGALCLLTGLLFGLAPAMRGAKLASDLSGRGATGHHSRQSINLNKLLVVSQVAISLVLLAGAGLFIRTLHNLRSQDLGIQRDHVLLVWTIPGQTGRQGPAMLDFWRSVQQRISSLAGVTSAGISNQGMLSGWQPQAPGDPTLIQGETPKSISLPGGPRAYVTPHFFESVRLPLIAGREFTERDNEKAPRVVVINESIARYYLGATNPIGRRLYAPADDPATSPWVEIVGVVKDPTAGTPRYKQAEFVWYPYRQNPHALSRMCVAVHTLGDPHNLIASVRRELQAIDSSIPILRVDTVGEQLDDVLVEERIAASLAGFFGALGVVLASVGLFGLLAYSAARRTNEIGIRMAVGATRPAVIALVLREALVLAAAGIAVGVPATLIAARLISAKLYGVGPADPLTFSAAAALLLAVSALAGFLPARRASNIDPMAALRHE